MIVKNLPDDSFINSVITSFQNQGKVIEAFERFEIFRQGTNISGCELFEGNDMDIYYVNQGLTFFNASVTGFSVYMRRMVSPTSYYTLLDMVLPASSHYILDIPIVFNEMTPLGVFTVPCTMTWVGYKIVTS